MVEIHMRDFDETMHLVFKSICVPRVGEEVTVLDSKEIYKVDKVRYLIGSESEELTLVAVFISFLRKL